MNADKFLVFNRRLSAFIGGWAISSVFQHPVSLVKLPRGSRSLALFYLACKMATGTSGAGSVSRPTRSTDHR
jgi:hypothetical protein